jgi:hypothetical protein
MRSLIAVLLVSLVAASSAAASSAKRPILGLRGDTLRGSNFKPSEKVTLLLAGTTRFIRTDARGSFTLLVRGIARKSHCGGGVVIQAFGAAGERASFQIGGLDCADVGAT